MASALNISIVFDKVDGMNLEADKLAPSYDYNILHCSITQDGSITQGGSITQDDSITQADK